MQLKGLKELYKKELAEIYNFNEILIFIEMILEKEFSIYRNEILLNPEIKFDKKEEDKLLKILERLKKNEPIQYILGEADFFGLKFCVNKHTLIPRNETEELVDKIIKNNKAGKLKILDIGTGSACIAISLAINMAKAEVFALDFSAEILEIAKRNADKNKCKLNLIQFDILNWEKNTVLKDYKFDIIVSNPPYIRTSEKKMMQKNVLDFEPSTALFVENENALIFYKEITKFAKEYLSENGKLYFEINEAFGKETAALLSAKGFQQIEVFKDLNGKDRFTEAINWKS